LQAVVVAGMLLLDTMPVAEVLVDIGLQPDMQLLLELQ
jgi:hypothetical protein